VPLPLALAPALASRAPSGLTATPNTASVWPVSGAPSGLPVAGVIA
jgi:hypothetical protein